MFNDSLELCVWDCGSLNVIDPRELTGELLLECGLGEVGVTLKCL